VRVLITGAGGMLGQSVVAALRGAGHEAVALDREALDVTDREAVRRVIESERPDAVVQCAAYTAVDAAESEYEQALLVNATATGYVAEACHRVGASFVYPSTDYVFDGTGTRPYRPDDPTRPVNAYGRSKLQGERAAAAAERHLVVRTSWLYGEGGPNFVETMLRLATERERLDVVDDQIGRPTWTRTLADAMVRLLEADAHGVLHVSDGGEATSWYGFAKEILESVGAGAKVHRTRSASFVRPAPRPGYSVLDLEPAERQLSYSLPKWKESLAGYLRETGRITP
jgi:dTDP-4-dehydrorhamnose reductase